MEKTKLKPCPFCGGEAELKQIGRNKIEITCKSCHVKRTQKTLYKTLDWLKNVMVKSWNERDYIIELSRTLEREKDWYTENYVKFNSNKNEREGFINGLSYCLELVKHQ